MTIDYTTPVGIIRNYIQDTDEANFEFADEQLQMFYDIRCEDLPFAIRDALQSLAVKYNKQSGDMYRIDTIEYQEGKSKASLFNTLLNQLDKQIEMGMAPGQSVSAHTYGIYTEEIDENTKRINDGEIVPPRHWDREADTIRLNPSGGPYYNS